MCIRDSDNYVLRGWGYRKAAELWHEKSGRWMEVYTDQPGIQIYTGNHFDGSLACKGGVRLSLIHIWITRCAILRSMKMRNHFS